MNSLNIKYAFYLTFALLVLTSSAFALTVPELPNTATASVHIAWKAPTKREDGTELKAEEIKGYELYYSLVDSIDAPVKIDLAPELTEYTLEGLPPGKYEFSMVTFDGNLYSKHSTPVTLDVTPPVTPPGAPDAIEVTIRFIYEYKAQ